MLKLMRQGAIDKPWFYRSIMLIIAVAFIVGMGWFGFGPSEEVFVAKVDAVQISRLEYRRAYDNAYRTYRNMLGDQFKEEDLQKLVINNLIDRQLWLKAAHQLDLSVGKNEVLAVLTQDRSFFRKGRFDPEQYRWVLKNSQRGMTPERYESGLREDLLLDKVRTLVSDGIILTTDEEEEARNSVLTQEIKEEEKEEAVRRGLENALRIKQQRAIVSFLNSIRSDAEIEIQDWLL